MSILLLVELLDAVGRTSWVTLRPSRSSWTAAQIQQYADAALVRLDGVLGSQIVAVHAQLVLSLPAGIKAAPEAGSSLVRGGVLSFETDAASLTTQFVAAVAASLEQSDYTLDTSDPALQAYANALSNGIDVDGEAVRVQDEFGEAYAALTGAAVGFRDNARVEPLITAPDSEPAYTVTFAQAWLPVILSQLLRLRSAYSWQDDVFAATARDLADDLIGLFVPVAVATVDSARVGTARVGG